MANEVVIRLDADVAAFLSKMAKASDEVEKTAKKSKGGLDDFLGQVAKIPTQMMTVAAAVALIGGTLDKVTQIRDKMGADNKSAGDVQMRAARASTMLGMDEATAREWMMKSGGRAGRDERVAFSESLAAIQEQRRRAGQREISQNDIQRAMHAYEIGGSSIHGQNGSDLIADLSSPYAAAGMNLDWVTQRRLRGRAGGTMVQGIYKPGDTDLLTKELLRRRGDGANTEDALRGAEAGIASQKQDIDFKNGQVDRVNIVMKAAADANSPYAAAIRDGIADKLDLVGAGGVVRAVGAGASRDMSATYLKEIRDALVGDSQKVKPNLDVRGEGSYGAAYVR